MKLPLVPLPSFENQLSQILKKFPKAEKQIRDDIEAVAKDPLKGFLFPGFGKDRVLKLKIPIKKYSISKRKGLRLIYAVKEDKIVLLYIYHKAKYQGEQKTMAGVKAALKEFVGGSDQG